MNQYNTYKSQLESFISDSNFQHDTYALRCCNLALEAAISGNVGVGALLVDPNDNIVAQGKNEIFLNGFRSDLHAEMVAMNSFENKQNTRLDLKKYTLISSLEPCPMCMTRLIFSGVGKIVFVCPDEDGGMARNVKVLPRVFIKFMHNIQQKCEEAICSPKLKQISYDIWRESRSSLDHHFE